MLQLPGVTLACVDTRTPALALDALQHCRSQVAFARTMLFTDLALVPSAPEGIELLPLSVASVADYSEFMLRGLADHIHTPHVLVVQWDGYVLDAGRWQPEFLECDYIGAPLRDEIGERAVGNGGFSLRSRKLLQALRDPALQTRHPEDLCICHDHRARLEHAHGIRFAPRALAERFAYERLAPTAPTFGFHGLFNMPAVLPPASLHHLVLSLPDALARGLDAHDLATTLIALGRLETAKAIIDKRVRLGMRDRRTWRLRLRWAWKRWQMRRAAALRSPD